MVSYPQIDLRILLVAPTGADSRNVVNILERSGFAAEAFRDITRLVAAFADGCGVVLITEEALTIDQRTVLAHMLNSQPKWSNVPIVLITSGGAEQANGDKRRGFANRVPVTILERPLRSSTLISAIEAALGSREQQYEIRDLLKEREAILNSLEERVTERTAKLTAMVHEMESFSYSVSHDLRAPLRVISGYADAVKEDFAAKLPEEGLRLLEKISNAARRMDRLTQDLLAYTRVANGEITLEPINVDEIVEHVLDGYPSIQEARHHIRVRKPLGICVGHAPSLEQILSNLLENALKFARPGSDPEISISSARIGDHLRLSITDKGIGIEPKDAQRIFGMFERIGKGTPGTGIGLAIVRKCVQRMHGRVGLTPRTGDRQESTEFWVELELAKGT
ncbi:MAG: ATP-binding protein [Candidatus Methylacidiphilales bacterium]|nr:ATP-binding protein [Candidatus Methylacidiphilales bacterium]